MCITSLWFHHCWPNVCSYEQIGERSISVSRWNFVLQNFYNFSKLPRLYLPYTHQNSKLRNWLFLKFFFRENSISPFWKWSRVFIFLNDLLLDFKKIKNKNFFYIYVFFMKPPVGHIWNFASFFFFWSLVGLQSKVKYKFCSKLRNWEMGCLWSDQKISSLFSQTPPIACDWPCSGVGG